MNERLMKRNYRLCIFKDVVSRSILKAWPLRWPDFSPIEKNSA